MEAERKETIERGRPPLPRSAFKIVNPVIKFILRSPFHRLLSGNFIVLTFKGRKSGRLISIPVGYTPVGDSQLVFTFSSWWRNLRTAPEVLVRLQGRQRKGQARMITDPYEVAGAVNLLMDRRGEEMGRRLGFQRIPEGASLEEIREKSQNLIFFQIDL